MACGIHFGNNKPTDNRHFCWKSVGMFIWLSILIRWIFGIKALLRTNNHWLWSNRWALYAHNDFLRSLHLFGTVASQYMNRITFLRIVRLLSIILSTHQENALLLFVTTLYSSHSLWYIEGTCFLPTLTDLKHETRQLPYKKIPKYYMSIVLHGKKYFVYYVIWKCLIEFFKNQLLNR